MSKYVSINISNISNNYSEFFEGTVHKLNDDSLYISCFSLVIILFGIVTNFISSLAFSTRQSLTSTNIYLTSLCLVDCIALFGLLINSIIYKIFIYFKYELGIKFIMFFYPYVYPIISTAQFASIYLTMSVSLNQFIVMAFSRGFSLKNNKLFIKKDIKKAYVIVLTIILFSVIFCIPYWFKFIYNQNDGLIRSEISESRLFNKIVHLLLYIPFAYVIPFIVLSTTNTYLLIKLIKTNNRREKLKTNDNNSNCFKHQQQQQQINNTTSLLLESKDQKKIIKNKFEMKNKSTMLVVIVFFFLVCQFPTLLLNLVETELFNDQKYKEHLFYFHFVELSKLLLIINLSFNFAFFYLFSKKFRTSLKNVLFNKKSTRNDDNNIIII